MKQNRMIGFVVITVIYAIAILVGIAVFLAFPDMYIFLRIFVGDIAATAFVYLTGVLLKMRPSMTRIGASRLSLY